MKPEYELYQQIDHYLKNKLSEAERYDFDQKIQQDEELAQQVKLQSLTNDILIEKRFNDIFAQAQIDYQNQSKINFGKKLLVAATTLLLIGSSAVLYYNTNTKLFSKKEHIQEKTEQNIVENKEISSPKVNQQVTIIQQNKTELQPNMVYKPINKEVVAVDHLKTVIQEADLPQKEKSSYPVIKLDHNTDINNVVVEADICATTFITANIFSSPACDLQSNGKIVIASTSVKGGKSPYLYSIDGVNYSENSEFLNLNSSNYNVSIKDGNGCIVNLNKTYHLESKKCFTQHNFSFNPQMGEVWTYQPEQNYAYSVKITSKRGMVVWQHNFADTELLTWEGNSSTGELQESGIYIYEINYVNGATEHGTITILK